MSPARLLGALNPTEIGAALQAAAPGMGPASPRNVLLQQLQSETGMGSQSLPGVLQGSIRSDLLFWARRYHRMALPVAADLAGAQPG